MFSSKILIHSCMIIHYVVEENWNVILTIALKLMLNKELKYQKGEYVRFKNYERKLKSQFTI